MAVVSVLSLVIFNVLCMGGSDNLKRRLKEEPPRLEGEHAVYGEHHDLRVLGLQANAMEVARAVYRSLEGNVIPPVFVDRATKKLRPGDLEKIAGEGVEGSRDDFQIAVRSCIESLLDGTFIPAELREREMAIRRDLRKRAEREMAGVNGLDLGQRIL